MFFGVIRWVQLWASRVATCQNVHASGKQEHGNARGSGRQPRAQGQG